MKTHNLVVTLFALSVTAYPVQSQELTTEQMIQMLRPSADSRGLGKSRGVAIEEGQIDDATSPTVNLYINFKYKSADLEQDARITLDRLALALRDDRLIEWEFLIGGHTDAVGSDAYNLALSDLRAMAVKKYLVENGGISEQRLLEKGFGEKRLLNTQDPNSGVNRRVQITTLAIPD